MIRIIGKNIDIDLRHPQIIGDLKKLSAKLSISKLTAKLSKNYRYRKKWVIVHPYAVEGRRNYAAEVEGR